MKSRRGSSSDALCCCEYINSENERSHILECCCNCDALDSLCDRLLTCRKVPNHKIEAMFETLEDRCRIPSCTGKGAKKIKLDIAIPLILVPTCLLLGTLNSNMTVLTLVALPTFLFGFYRLWMRRPQKNRTQLFYVWGLVSVFQMYVTFELYVVAIGEVQIWENAFLNGIFILMMFALYHAKKDPGFLYRNSCTLNAAQMDKQQEYLWKQQQLEQQLLISELEKMRQAQTGQSKEHSSVSQNGHSACCSEHKTSASSAIKVESETGADSPAAHLKEVVDAKDFKPEFGLLGNILMQNFGFGSEGFEENMKEQKEKMAGQVIPEEEVTWVDSRITSEGFLVTWCPYCKLHKLPRSGHCPVCDICVEGRDHHCVWIDCCIGARNHRAFICALVLFILGGAYGAFLTLSTLCRSELYWNWLLLPSNCPDVYASFDTSLCWVSACYTVLSILGMLAVLLQQSLLIGQDLTSQELHTSWRRGWGYWMCFTQNNSNNRGCLRNWYGFLSRRRRRNPTYPSFCV